MRRQWIIISVTRRALFPNVSPVRSACDRLDCTQVVSHSKLSLMNQTYARSLRRPDDPGAIKSKQ